MAGRNGMVVSAHPLASQAGLEILKRGGNAIDAAVVTSLVLSVVEPYSSGIGGGGFMLVYVASEKRVRSFDFRERAPLRATKLMYAPLVRAGKQPSRLGGLAVAVPGQVAGLYAVHKKYGKLPWARVVLPAVRIARRGFAITPKLRQAIERMAPHFNDAAKAIFVPNGRIPAVGDRLVQRDLARLLAAIARHGARAFYHGRYAKLLVEGIIKEGGIVSLDDLARYEVKERAPVHGRYRGREIYSMPPPSSGGLHLVQMLNVLSHFDLRRSGFLSSLTIHWMAEAMKFAYRDRAKYLGDPDFVTIPVRGLLALPYARTIARRIRLDRQIVLPEDKLRKGPMRFEHNSTTHFSIVDGAGNAVALTQTINLWFGAAFVAKGTGVVLNNEMDDFSILPGLPNAFGLLGGEANAVAPGKRPLSSMTPTIVLRDGAVEIVVGSPGGSRIITTVLQILVNLIDHRMTVERAIASPRIHFQWWPDKLFFEPHALPIDVQRVLRSLGWVLSGHWPMGNAQLIRVDSTRGLMIGAADPRGEGTVAAY